MVFLVMEGEATHRFGLQEHRLGKHMLCFVSPDMISSWELADGDQRGYICSFSDDFFHAGLADRQALSRLPFFRLDGQAVMQLSDTQAEEYITLFGLMKQEYEKVHNRQSTVHSKMQNTDSHEVLQSYLHALISKARADQAYMNIPDMNDRADMRLLRMFTELLDSDFASIRNGESLTIRKVFEYADQLGVSQNHLNDTIQALTGLSAGQHIRNRLVQQATMCLMHSDKTVSEIAYRLGYEDPSYFARFYKSQTGKTPSSFRKKQTPGENRDTTEV
jgi:AraC-like DNA-binding protein